MVLSFVSQFRFFAFHAPVGSDESGLRGGGGGREGGLIRSVNKPISTEGEKREKSHIVRSPVSPFSSKD